jgi:hypothetical protein
VEAKHLSLVQQRAVRVSTRRHSGDAALDAHDVDLNRIGLPCTRSRPRRQSYLDEFDFRFSSCHISDTERMHKLIGRRTQSTWPISGTGKVNMASGPCGNLQKLPGQRHLLVPAKVRIQSLSR